MPPDPYRLPRTVVPAHYRIDLIPDLGASTFTGTVVIDVAVAEPTAEIVLNAAELDRMHATVTDSAGSRQEGAVASDESLERMTITLPHPVAAGNATVSIVFAGRINDDLRGFYRSVFRDADGTEHVIATTQFESTDARRAFPCWDEPEFKATFDVRMLVPDGLLAVSNGPVVDSTPADNGTWVTFGTTMKMSTYLVAFVVGPLVATDALDVDGVPLRVVCVPGRENLAPFALEVGAHALRFFTSYFDIPYPAAKLDLIALPDFAFGAMENLGCVTFRETALLVDAGRASRLDLERVADVVSHEIAHMWFGDLVTMKWWNGIWLNEAFATFMEVAAVDAFRPKWERWVSFSTERSAAMLIDGLASTRPIEYEVVSPDDAQGMFDVLTYQKGGAVLRMLETYLGADRFRDGIRLYLKRHEYANTETTDLWDAIEEATGEPVRSIMDSWILQGGHPLVTASEEGGSLRLTQRRFRYSPSSDDESARWQVPVLLRPLDGGESDRVLLQDGSVSLPLERGTLVANGGGWGVFRTRYQGALHAKLIDAFSRLEAIERYNLVSDTWAAAVGGQAAVGDFLDLVNVLVDERHPSVWATALGSLDMLHRIHPVPRVEQWARALLRPAFERLGWEPVAGEDDLAPRLRAALAGTLGTIAADQTIVSRARDLFGALDGVSPDLHSPIADIVAWNGGPEDYDEFWNRVRSATTPQDEMRYLYRLSAFGSVDLLHRTLDAVLGEVRSQNGAFVITASIANRKVGRDAWAWLTAHWDAVLARLPENTHGRMIDGVVTLVDPVSLKEVPAFLDAHPIPSARKQIAQLLERQQINAAFAARAAEELTTRFG